MDKTTRVLILYQRLMRGTLISKPLYAMEFGIAERSFDRDVQALRLFLSESFSNLELIYDENRKSYHLKNLIIKREIDIGECYILSKLLLDSHPLRTDDLGEILQILLSHLTPTSRERILPVLRRAPEISTCLEKISVKLIEDLLFSIERKDRISLQFGPGYSEICCVPYSVEFHGEASFLVGWELEPGVPALFPLDEILSYVPKNQPYFLGQNKEDALQALVFMIYHTDIDEYKSFIHQKESD